VSYSCVSWHHVNEREDVCDTDIRSAGRSQVYGSTHVSIKKVSIKITHVGNASAYMSMNEMQIQLCVHKRGSPANKLQGRWQE
jgi:hypothetical protein